jgi:hypothetical protein
MLTVQDHLGALSTDGRMVAELVGGSYRLRRVDGGQVDSDLHLGGLNIIMGDHVAARGSLRFVGPERVAYVRHYSALQFIPPYGIHVFDLRTGKEIRVTDWEYCCWSCGRAGVPSQILQDHGRRQGERQKNRGQ